MTERLDVFKVWTKEFYESKFMMFPRDDQYVGQFEVKNESELKDKLISIGHKLSLLSWEKQNA